MKNIDPRHYDIMRRKTLVLTKAALDALEARFK